MLILTRRRDQATANNTPADSPLRNQLIGGIICPQTPPPPPLLRKLSPHVHPDYQRPHARDARLAIHGWIRRLHALHPLHYNYFVIFYDVRGIAVQFGHAAWHPPYPARPYIDD